MEAANDNVSNFDYGFAFNHINFSDRVLRIEIEQGDKTEFSSLGEIEQGDKTEFSSLGEIEQGDKTEFSSLGISFADLMLRLKEKRADLILRLKGKRTTKKDNEKLGSIKVKSIHISSPILAAKSVFFLKLFSNGMKESNERIATLRIHSSEEDALMELLNFMYTNTLKSAKSATSTATTSSLLDVMMVADKFQVSSCIRYCINLLLKLPMTYESASYFLHRSSIVTMPDEVQPLTDAAKKHIADCYKDITKFEKDLITLPLGEIEAILSRDDLQVVSEDVVYEFVLKWAGKHYPMVQKRREITTQLASLIRFQNMSVPKLKHMLTCNDFDPACASKAVNEALFLKAESTHLRTIHASRAYTRLPVKVLEFMFPNPHCIVYFDLKREVLNDLQPTKSVYSEPFCLGGKSITVTVTREPEPSGTFGLFLCISAGTFYVSYEFSARSKPTEAFVRKGKATCTHRAEEDTYGFPNLFSMSWSEFMSPDSIYFINGVLYLKLEIAMK